MDQFALDSAVRIDPKQAFLQPEKEKFRFPLGQVRTNPNPGNWRALAESFAQSGKGVLKPPLEISPPFFVSRASQSNQYRVARIVAKRISVSTAQIWGMETYLLRPLRGWRLFSTHKTTI